MHATLQNIEGYYYICQRLDIFYGLQPYIITTYARNLLYVKMMPGDTL